MHQRRSGGRWWGGVHGAVAPLTQSSAALVPGACGHGCRAAYGGSRACHACRGGSVARGRAVLYGAVAPLGCASGLVADPRGWGGGVCSFTSPVAARALALACAALCAAGCCTRLVVVGVLVGLCCMVLSTHQPRRAGSCCRARAVCSAPGDAAAARGGGGCGLPRS